MASNSGGPVNKKLRGPTWGETSSKPPAGPPLIKKDYSSKILTELNYLRQSDMLCDYTVCTDDKEMKVHRAVIVACSDYFRAMLTGGMIESRESTVHLKGITGAGMEAVVDFAYTGQLSVTMDNLEDVLLSVSHLQVPEAMELCCEFMERSLTIDNCVDLLHLSDLYTLTHTRPVITAFILEHFESLADTDTFLRLSGQQLASLLAQDSLKVVSEYRLFELVMRWIEKSKEKRQTVRALLISHVRLPLLAGDELVDKVGTVDLMMHNKKCVKFLKEAKDYHLMEAKQPLLQTERTCVRTDKDTLVLCHGQKLKCYDFEADVHSLLQDPMVPIFKPCVVVLDNFLYACGGTSDSNEITGTPSERCYRYDPRFNRWFEVASMQVPRKEFVLLLHERSLYAIGGREQNKANCTMERYTIAKNNWKLSTAFPNALFTHAGAVLRNRVYISGGQTVDGHCRTVKSMDLKTNQWKDEPPLISIRINHSMAAIGGCLYVVGGNTKNPNGAPFPVTSIERFDPDMEMWSVMKTTLNVRDAGFYISDNKMVFVGGIDGHHHYSDLLQSYNPQADQLEILKKFTTRIIPKACGIMRLPRHE